MIPQKCSTSQNCIFQHQSKQQLQSSTKSQQNSPSLIIPDKLQGHCYCGNIKFQIKTTPPPYKSLYCHCQSCRRAHSAPLYQICYIPHQCFIFVKGQQNITQFAREKQGSPIRAFCKICGSRIYNKLPAQPQLGIGFFPALLQQSIQRNLPSIFKPKLHYLSHQAILQLNQIDDGLPRT